MADKATGGGGLAGPLSAIIGGVAAGAIGVVNKNADRLNKKENELLAEQAYRRNKEDAVFAELEAKEALKNYVLIGGALMIFLLLVLALKKK